MTSTPSAGVGPCPVLMTTWSVCRSEVSVTERWTIPIRLRGGTLECPDQGQQLRMLLISFLMTQSDILFQYSDIIPTISDGIHNFGEFLVQAVLKRFWTLSVLKPFTGIIKLKKRYKYCNVPPDARQRLLASHLWSESVWANRIGPVSA